MTNPSKQFEMIRLYPFLNSDPLNGKVGEIYYNTSLNVLRLCIDSSPIWTNVGESKTPFQDRNLVLINGGDWKNNGGTLSWTQPCYIQIPGIPDNSNKIVSGNIPLNDGEVLYVDINRTEFASTLTPVVGLNADISFDSNRLIIARRIGDVIIVNDRLSLVDGEVGNLDIGRTSIDTAMMNLSLHGGGIWSFNQSNSLAWSEDAYIQVVGLLDAANTIPTGSVVISPGYIIYVELENTGSANTLSLVSAAKNVTLPLNSFILAYFDGTKVWLANGESLIAGESKKNGESVSVELLSALGASGWADSKAQLRLLAEKTPSSYTEITAVNKVGIDSTIRSFSIKNSDVKFSGCYINWASGAVLNETKTVTIQNFSIPASYMGPNAYRWHSVSLKPESLNSNNERSLSVVIIPASGDGAALKARYAQDAIPVGQVLIQTIGGVAQAISQSAILQNSFIGAELNEFIKVDLLDAVSNTLPTGSAVTIDGEVCANGALVLFTNLASGNNQIYELTGVGSSISWIPRDMFEGNLVPSDGDFVQVKRGTIFADQKAVFNGTRFEINNTIRLFDGTTVSFLEFSSIRSTTLYDNLNVWTPLLSFDKVLYSHMVIEYSLVKGGIFRVGRFLLTNDGTNVGFHDDYTETEFSGVNFDAMVVGNDVKVTYTSTNMGSNGVFKYTSKRWY